MKAAIQVDRVSKLFRLGARQKMGQYQTLREALVEAVKGPFRRLRAWGKGERPAVGADDPTLWALKDVSLEIMPGEVVGLIGRNGAGKSTLLKVLSRIIDPSQGRAILRGRVGSLLEVGTGFHPELTGRENIYLNGSILGMTRREITRKFDEIVAFSEMDRFLDTPVKRYSSGMYVRLAFAVAAHLDLEILLVDEVLAVGDMEFQKKTLKKMEAIAQGGRTVVFVSHNLGMIHRLCTKGILLKNGRVEAIGDAQGVIQTYLKETLQHQGHWERPVLDKERDVCLLKAEICGKDGGVCGIVNCEDPFQIRIEYEINRRMPTFVIGFQLRNSQGVTIFTTMDHDTYTWPEPTRSPGRYHSTCNVPGHLLAPGTYFMNLGAAIINQQTLDAQHEILAFEVSESGCIQTRLNDRREGVITPLLDWQVGPLN